MGNDVVLPGERQSLAEPFGPLRGHGLHLEDRTPAGDGLDLQSLLRILNEHRKMLLAAMVVGLIGGLIMTLITPKMYRANVTLEVNAPKVEILNEENGGEAPTSNSWDFIATQVGLLRSRTLAERVAQDLNLAGDPAIVGVGGTPAERLRTATSVVAGGLSAEMPEDGQLIQYSYVSTSPDQDCRVRRRARPWAASTSITAVHCAGTI